MLGVPKVTASLTCPRGEMEPLVTPVKGLEGMSQSYGTWSISNVSTEMTFRPAPPSMRVLLTAMLLMVGVQTRGRVPTVLVDLGWSLASKAMVYCGHLRGWDASTPGRAALSSRANCLNWLLDLGA